MAVPLCLLPVFLYHDIHPKTCIFDTATETTTVSTSVVSSSDHQHQENRTGILETTTKATAENTSVVSSGENQQQESYILETTSNETAENSSVVSSNDLQQEEERSKFAFIFVIGGCNPEEPLKYRGFVYNIMIAARLFQTLGSKADVLAFFQLSYASNATSLPDDDLRPLEGLNVQVRYIPPSKSESFYETNLNKFQILKLTQYQRVIFMDGDIIPLANMDYLFELSMQGVLKPNLVVSAPNAPANGGFFMFAPKPGDYDLVQQLIEKREEKEFSPEKGWGHVITPPDEWVMRGKRGRLWNFYGGPVDQGLCTCSCVVVG